jgi:hypothetical protein
LEWFVQYQPIGRPEDCKLNQLPQKNHRRNALSAVSASRLPNLIEAAAQTCDGQQLVQHTAQFASNAGVTDSGDLVACALEILAEEVETWRARQTASLGGNP